jgi:hypothetical protein
LDLVADDHAPDVQVLVPAKAELTTVDPPRDRVDRSVDRRKRGGS